MSSRRAIPIFLLLLSPSSSGPLASGCGGREQSGKSGSGQVSRYSCSCSSSPLTSLLCASPHCFVLVSATFHLDLDGVVVSSSRCAGFSQQQLSQNILQHHLLTSDTRNSCPPTSTSTSTVTDEQHPLLIPPILALLGAAPGGREGTS